MRVVVRGGGDLATGVIHKLYQCGFEVIILECAQPTAILLVTLYIINNVQ